ncbi:DUF3299 domain-containing protein [Acuticoccus mangrovi]|uniref:DUF3299 domain-containing protein n=1 Tax=Acuticoccus mangrovi TaxID=2796142 RepID=A0A934IHV9_9HYPH|nr:DUF3299 domain-containing protein [Acuticoccus mangrovi]MBJ3777004.1 DUF3299 domain-containing protein [Acuticoccus mangrovi]
MKRLALLALVVSAAPFLANLGPVPALAASATVEIDWRDLIPPRKALDPFDEMKSRLSQPDKFFAETTQPTETPRGIVQHGQLTTALQGSDVVTRFNGQTVKLSGFVIPLDYSGLGVTSFMLVPFVGACIHVPPPPPNQLVFVTTETPFEVQGLFEPVTVTGEFNTATTSTELAEVGYVMTAKRVDPFE